MGKKRDTNNACTASRDYLIDILQRQFKCRYYLRYGDARPPGVEAHDLLWELDKIDKELSAALTGEKTLIKAAMVLGCRETRELKQAEEVAKWRAEYDKTNGFTKKTKRERLSDNLPARKKKRETLWDD